MACQGTSSTSGELFRPIEDSDDKHEGSVEHEDQEAVRAEAERRYPDRGRRPPRWLEDYMTDSDFDRVTAHHQVFLSILWVEGVEQYFFHLKGEG